jgi:hypothetical protein
MVANLVYWRRNSGASKRIFATIKSCVIQDELDNASSLTQPYSPQIKMSLRLIVILNKQSLFFVLILPVQWRGS